jgi:GNAT superfamily N-acetyltransferase
MRGAAAVEVIAVTSRAHKSAFLHLPKSIYASDPNWIAPLDIERRIHFDHRKNPFFHHAEGQFFLALEGNRPVGRISAHVDHRHLERYGDATGQFGFLEAIDRQEVFAALLSRAENWLKERGLRRVQGPFSFSINDESGLLVHGFEHPPAIMMNHARPYYGDRIVREGYVKAKDLIAYRYYSNTPVPPAIQSMLDKNRKSGKLVVRPFSKRHFARDLAIIIDIFNDAWSTNWNFVPMTPAEIKNLGDVLKFLVKNDHIAIASYENEPAAMIVTLPDINRMCRDLGGRLLPLGWAKLLWRLYFTTHEAFRVPLLGVRKKFRSSAVSSMLAVAVMDAIRAFHVGRGTYPGELSWILEDNLPTRRLLEAIGGQHYKTYRVYEKSIA